MIGIYKIENLINGKVYIGKSINIEDRWKKHHYKPFYPQGNQYNSAIYRAIRKYGLDYFSFEILEECNQNELDEKEIYWIAKYDAHNKEKGYNLTDGGEGMSGAEVKLTKEQILEIYELLNNTQLSQVEIGERFGVSQYYISLLNRGINKPQEGYTYPIRPLYYLQKQQKGKGKNGGSICPICGGNKDKDAKVCLNCYKKQRKENKEGKYQVSREELKQLIRTKPFTQLGKMFGVSDNAVRKWCDGYGLPRKKTDINNYTDEEWELI